METYETHSLLSVMQYFILCLLCFMAKVESSSENVTVSALYVFGDSTVDAGNNNYIKTLMKSNFAPYGRDFPNHEATGRFTNGKLATDYIASYAGLKNDVLLPYLDPKLNDKEELLTGVSFASAASGFDPLTPTLSNVIAIQKQLEYFREYKKRLEGVLGKERTENHIQNAAFLVSAGTNDFVVNYFTVPIRRKSYTLFTYQEFLIQQVKDFIQDLWEEGAREIAVVGLPPMGCLPIMISFNSFQGRGCIDKYSSIARDYNEMLQHELQLMQLNLSNPGAHIYYIDIYRPLADMIQDPKKYGFDQVDSGCCGTGYIETSFLCNKNSEVCSDPSKYVFWDSIHPTEKAYHNIFLAARSTIDFIINNIQHKGNTTASSWQLVPPSIPSSTARINSYAIYLLLFVLAVYGLWVESL